MTIAILILSVFVFFLLLKYKDLSAPQVHFFYIALILLSLLIILATKNLGDDKKLVNLVTFAATLSSLVLAVIAIIYSIISQDSLKEKFGKLDKVSDDLDKVSEDISKKSTLFDNTANNILGSLKSMEQGMKEMHTDVKSVSQKQDAQSQETNSKISELSKMIITAPAVPIAPGTLVEPSDSISREKLFEYFFAGTSLFGLMLLYAIKKASDKDGILNLKLLLASLAFGDYNYAYGFLIATLSWGAVSFKMEDEIITVTQVNEYIKKDIYDILSQRAAKFNLESPGPIDAVNEIRKIDLFFTS